jgi:hypothetical protein
MASRQLDVGVGSSHPEWGILRVRGEKSTDRAWEPMEVAMDRLRERFVGQYAEPTSWDYSIWLGLTAAGRPVAKVLRRLKTLAARESHNLLLSVF